MTNRRVIGLALAIAILSAGAYLLASGTYFRTGYPLDDAYIHQTFARNLVRDGQWAVNPGEPTAGSTSPLWTLLLSLGYLLHIPHPIWTYGLGIGLLAGMAFLAIHWTRTYPDAQSWLIAAAGGLMATEWHLVWASVSGMEILLLSLLVLSIFFQLTRPAPRWLWIGILGGLAVWVRPDGLTLLGPIGLALLACCLSRRSWKEWSAVLVPFALFFGGLLIFNYTLSGSIWPNTFAAKQTEYEVLQQTPILTRYLKLWFVPLTGVGLILLPGLVRYVVLSIRKKAWSELGLFLWLAGYIGIYAWKLPVVYQHGRYLMPVIPVLIMLSILGLRGLNLPELKYRWRFVFSRVYLGLWIVIPIGFMVLGAQAYARDVAVIESEMVESARWIAANTPADSVIAAHDIGALGYYGNRRILDLAGLINPQIIPDLDSSAAISDYLQQTRPDYVIIFPDWYVPPLTVPLEEVYSTGGTYSPAAGGSNLTLYILKP